ncbi:hypothetical protein BSKO_04379 [Bryopsis sp. KO-2023]|nr:hypothetical protein BSKO_04379 [Bryopsis sp. KO-2023]
MSAWLKSSTSWCRNALLVHLVLFLLGLRSGFADLSFRFTSQRCADQPTQDGCCPLEALVNVARSADGIAPRMLIGIGAQKSATSFMAYLLKRHPGFLEPSRKELSYFNDDTRSRFALEDYLPHWDASQASHKDPVYYEFTPDYMPHAFVPCRMRAVIPNAKFLVILRSPVDRFYSHVNMERHFCKNAKLSEEFGVSKKDVCEGTTSALRPLDELMEAHVDALARIGCTFDYGNNTKSWIDCQSAYDGFKLDRFGKGLYGAQLAWWMELFPPDRFLILETNEVTEDPEGVLDRVARFALGAAEAESIDPPIINTCRRNTFQYDPENNLHSTLERLSKRYAQPNMDLQQFLSELYTMDSDLVSPGIGAELSKHIDWSEVPKRSLKSYLMDWGPIYYVMNFFQCSIVWKRYRRYSMAGAILLSGVAFFLWRSVLKRTRYGVRNVRKKLKGSKNLQE